MTTTQRLAQGHNLAAWVEEQVNELPLGNGSLRVRLPATCFIVAQEHHQAILILLSQTHPVHASAFALVRPVYEAYLRGVWLARCATKENLERFSKGESPPKMPVMLAAIEKTPEYGSGQLSDIYTRSWTAMCAYTHTGSEQVQRWNTSDAIQQDYPDADVEEVLTFTGALVLLSTIGLAAIAENVGLAERVLSQAREFGYEF